MSPMASTPTLMAATINGQPGWKAELDIQQDITYVRSLGAVKPDPAWEYTDPAGHYHAWANDRELPTLRAKTVDMPCNGACDHIDPDDCEGFSVTVYECRVCHAPVDPQVVPDFEARDAPGIPIEGLRSWHVSAGHLGPHMPGQLCEEVSVVLHDDQRTLFGFAMVASYEMSGVGLDAAELVVQLVGSGPLGERLASSAL